MAVVHLLQYLGPSISPPNLIDEFIFQHDMLRRDRETLLFPDNFLRNFHLKPTGDVVLYLCRSVKVGDDWVRPKVTFLIAASYWKEALFMPDGIGGWKSSITNEAITEQALKREIGDHIEYGIYSDRTFRAACESVVEDAAARQKDGKGPAPMSCIVWPSEAQIDLDDASLIEALPAFRKRRSWSRTPFRTRS